MGPCDSGHSAKPRLRYRHTPAPGRGVVAGFFLGLQGRAVGRLGLGLAGVGCSSSSRPLRASGRWSVGGGLLLAGAFAWSATGAPIVLPPTAEVLAVVTRVNDYWIATHTTPMGNNWNPAVYHVGNLEAWRVTGKPAYYRYALDWAEYHSWQTYNYRPASPSTFADYQCCGQVYTALYLLENEPDPAHLAVIQESLGIQVDREKVDDWTWIDAIFMSAPVFASLAAHQGNPAYGRKLKALFQYTRDSLGLYDAAEGLWYRDAGLRYPARMTANGKQIFWARGNGWVIAAMARVLDLLPETDPYRQEYRDMLQAMAAALAELHPLHGQTTYGDDGFWRASLYDPTEYPNPETTGTAAFVYALAWGVNRGLLDDSYLPIIVKAWNGMVNGAVHPEGLLGWCQTPNVAPAATTYEQTTDYGVGLFLLAGAEVAQLAGPLSPWVLAIAGPDQAVHDNYSDGVEDVILDGTASYGHGAAIASYEWRIGGVVVGTAAVATVPLPLGQHVATLTVTDGASRTSSDSVLITVAHYRIAPVLAATASSDDGNGPQNAVDSDLSTRWSASGYWQWLELDLGVPVQVASVGIAFQAGASRVAYFDLDASVDRRVWTRLGDGLSSSGTTLALQTFATPVTEARYVRVIGHGNSANAWNSITEVAIYTGPLPYRADQEIRFDILTDASYGDGPLALVATATSGLPVVFSADTPRVLTVSGTTVTIRAVGSATITATQPGDANWLPAVAVERTLTITPKRLIVTADDQARLYGEPNPAFSLHYSGFVNGNTIEDLDAPPTAACDADATSPAGRYPIVPAGGTDSNYSFQYENGTLTVYSATHTASFSVGLHGSLSGPSPQTVPHGSDTLWVTAVPDRGYAFDHWDDRPAANPRQDTGVMADFSARAEFRLAEQRPPDGEFSAAVEAVGVAAGKGLWDLSGSYSTKIAGKPLSLHVFHDTDGRLTGGGTYTLAKAAVVSLPIRGSVRGMAGRVGVILTLKGTTAAGQVSVRLNLEPRVDGGSPRLMGTATGSIRANAETTTVAETVTLTMPGSMDGTWTLWLDLAPTGRAVQGSARLALSNGVNLLLAANGKRVGEGAILSLTGAAGDPSTRRFAVHATVATLEGGWARLGRCSGRGYGQRLVW